jgi:hypothetical protein
MKIKNILQILVTYYTTTRQVGHTTLMTKGILSSNQCIVITNKEDMFNYMKKNWNFSNGAVSITLNNLENLRGTALPLTFDNAALQTIFDKSLIEIQKLEQEKKKLEQENSTIKQKLAQVKNILKP